MKKKYTDITSSNTPTDSEPILFEIYTLKNIPIVLNIRDVQVRIIPLTKNNFIFFKLSPDLSKYMINSIKELLFLKIENL